MEGIVVDYKQDVFSNSIQAHIFCPTEKPAMAMPIGLAPNTTLTKLILTIA